MSNNYYKKYRNKVAYLDFNRIEVTREFIVDNKFVLKQDYEAIKAKGQENDYFGFKREVLSNYLPYELISDWYNEEYQQKVKNGEEVPSLPITDIGETVQDFLDYMVFAWGKALDQRGLSASRSISKLGTWLWLLSREDLESIIDQDDLYVPYGIPALIAICEELDIKYPTGLAEAIEGDEE